MFEASGLPGPHPPAAWVGTRGCTPDARGAPLECVDCDHSTAWRARNPWWAGGASQRALVQRAVENAFTVMVAPSAPRVHGRDFPQMPQPTTVPYFIRYVEGLAERSGFETLDLLGALSSKDWGGMLYYCDDHHWNERGNEVVARILAKQF